MRASSNRAAGAVGQQARQRRRRQLSLCISTVAAVLLLHCLKRERERVRAAAAAATAAGRIISVQHICILYVVARLYGWCLGYMYHTSALYNIHEH